MQTLKIDVSDAASIAKAIEALTKVRDTLERLPNQVVQAVTETGENLAKQNVAYFNALDTGELMNSIVSEVNDKRGLIKATAPHAAYVEYGTGYRGQNSPHPEPGSYDGGWAYDINQHGVGGWIYRGDDGQLHYTQGFRSRPYMYDTASMLKRMIPKIAREELNKIL